MNVQVFVLLILLVAPFFSPEGQPYTQESDVLRTIIFMRTEGLGTAELFEVNTRNKNNRVLCQRMKSYYSNTQPALIEICRGKDLQLSDKDVEVLLSRLKRSFEGYKDEKENDYLLLCEAHVNKSIQLYTKLVQDHRWEHISYFSFIALPELFNLKQEIRKLKK